MQERSLSLLTAEISQGSLQKLDQVVLTGVQVEHLQSCIDWYNERLHASPSDLRTKSSFVELITDSDGYHRVRVGGTWTYNIINWCVMYEDFKRRLGLKYHDPLGRDT